MGVGGSRSYLPQDSDDESDSPKLGAGLDLGFPVGSDHIAATLASAGTPMTQKERNPKKRKVAAEDTLTPKKVDHTSGYHPKYPVMPDMNAPQGSFVQPPCKSQHKSERGTNFYQVCFMYRNNKKRSLTQCHPTKLGNSLGSCASVAEQLANYVNDNTFGSIEAAREAVKEKKDEIIKMLDEPEPQGPKEF